MSVLICEEFMFFFAGGVGVLSIHHCYSLLEGA